MPYRRQAQATLAPDSTWAAPPPPDPAGFWEGAGATMRNTVDRSENDQFFRKTGGYSALAESIGRKLTDFQAPLSRQINYLNPFHTNTFEDYYDTDALWAAVQANPHRDAKLPKTRAEYETMLLERNGGHAADAEVEARSGLGARLAGGVVGGLADPANVLTSLAGGGGKTLWGTVGREALLNMGIEAMQTPSNNRGAAALGEHLTLGDDLTNIGMAGAGGGLLGGLGHVATHVGGPRLKAGREALLAKLIPHLPEALRPKIKGLDDIPSGTLADAVEAAFGKDNLSPDMSAALNMARREGDVAASNPYVENFAGLKAHGDQLQAAMDRIMGDNPVRPVRATLGDSSGLRSGIAAPGSVAGGAGPDAAAIAGFKRAIGGAESPNDFAKNPGSSAQGRYQFTDSTWLRYHAKVFGETGESRAAILAKKTDGMVQEKLMDRLTADHVASLQAIGAPVTKENLYIMHFGGDAGGPRLLRAADDAPIRTVLGDKAVNANRFLEGMNAAQARAELARRVGGKAGPAVPGGMGSEADGLALDGMRADQELAAAGDALRQADVARGPVVDAETAGLMQPVSQGADVPLPEDIPTLKPEYRDEMPHYLARVEASKINVDAETFQFKAGGDQYGVTDRLANVDKWQPGFSGRVILWEDAQGKMFVADGHQRTGLARRIGAKEGRDIQLDAYVLREADGVSARDARTFAALKNIADESGTITDMAKVLRDAGPDALRKAGVPRGAKARHAEGVSRLSPEAFGAVINKVIPEEYGAVIGARLPDDPAAHMAMVDLLAKAKPANATQADDIVRQGIAAGFHEGEQVDMFGQLDTMASLFTERAKVKDAAMAKLRGLKRIFGTAAKEADTLEGAGSKIDVAASTKEALSNDEALALIDKLAWSSGPVKDAIDRAAKRLADGEPLARVSGDLASDIRAIDLRTAAMDGGQAGGDIGRSAGLERPDPIDAKPLDPQAQAQLSRFDDPIHSEAADWQADSTQHDLGMFAKANPDAMVTMEAGAEPVKLSDMLDDVDEEMGFLDMIDVCMKPGN